MTHTATADLPDKVIPLHAPTPELEGRLRYLGDAHSPRWLPSDARWEGVEELRAEHIEHIRRIHAVTDLVYGPGFAIERQTREYEEACKEAIRTGKPAPADPRMPQAEIDAHVRKHRPQLVATWELYADWLDAAFETIQAHQAQWMGHINEDRQAAAAKRREAERLLTEVGRIETHVQRRAIWLERACTGRNQSEAESLAEWMAERDAEAARAAEMVAEIKARDKAMKDALDADEPNALLPDEDVDEDLAA